MEQLNEYVCRACANSCADFLYGFVESSSKKGEEYWLLRRFEGEATLADLMQSREFPYNYGRIVDIVVLKTPKLRVQAWVVFTEVTGASNVVRQMQNFPFYNKPMLAHAISREDYEDAARLKVAIAAVATKDIVGRAMSHVHKVVEEERYRDAVFIRDCAGTGLEEACRTDVPEDKKYWRRTTLETESGRRWREEERETSLLGRTDRRKTDRRAEHDFNNRNSGLDTRRDSKWSSRWGPNDKEKENRSEKRIDVDKEDVHNDAQTLVANRTVSERESDCRVKWRPRHRMEGNSAALNSYRAAPGFGQERGKVDRLSMGFNLHRGRSTGTIVRPSSGGTIGASPF